MDNKPLQEFPQPDRGKQGEISSQLNNFTTKWRERLSHLGIGETTLRIGTNVLAISLVVMVVWLLQHANLGTSTSALATSDITPVPTLQISAIPVEIAYVLNGIPRQAELHTTIPSRPRIDVATYTVQTGDTLFGIAEKYGLKPSTLLFGNYDTLKDTPHSLRPGQTLFILPVDGTYYEWQGIENLDTVAAFFGVDSERIINFPGNHLDPDAIGDMSTPNIKAGTWLVVPGGTRAFNSWSAPIGITRSNPATTRVMGLGACGAISGGNVGFGTFIYPTVQHWLSGTNFHPELGHPAVDFAGSMGNAIYATDAGVVVYAGWNDYGYGNLIILDHGNGWQSLYGHLSQVNVSCGQSVGQGDVIGLMGSTGNSTGPHLHFELMNTNLGKVNPLDYLPAP
jgi:murein DD-endopeptidase MepM/ murein hydrolase activator NlpD